MKAACDGCGRCKLQKSADLLRELHTVVGRHADTIELQQAEISRLEAEMADLLRSYASVQKERDDAVDEIKCVQQQNDKLVAQHKLEVGVASCN